jgi:hypothetical protein
VDQIEAKMPHPAWNAQAAQGQEGGEQTTAGQSVLPESYPAGQGSQSAGVQKDNLGPGLQAIEGQDQLKGVAADATQRAIETVKNESDAHD